jgi:hypothetical protein
VRPGHESLDPFRDGAKRISIGFRELPGVLEIVEKEEIGGLYERINHNHARLSCLKDWIKLTGATSRRSRLQI